MTIGEIIKVTQPKAYRKLQKFIHTKVKHKEQLTEKDVRELMGHNSYRRGHGGAIRQVR